MTIQDVHCVETVHAHNDEHFNVRRLVVFGYICLNHHEFAPTKHANDAFSSHWHDFPVRNMCNIHTCTNI